MQFSSIDDIIEYYSKAHEEKERAIPDEDESMRGELVAC